VVVRDVAEAMAVDPGLVSFAAEAPTGVVSPTAALMAQSADAVFGARYVRMGAAVVYTCLCLEGCGMCMCMCLCSVGMCMCVCACVRVCAVAGVFV
jgi:hypothetical protein